MAMFNKEDISRKDDFTCMMLAIFLGRFGAHRFYVGKIGTGILYFVTCNLDTLVWLLCKAGVSFLNSLVITVITYMIMGVMCLYDIYAIYSECFTDKQGKVVASKATREDCGAHIKSKWGKFENALLVLMGCVLYYTVMYGIIRR